MRFDENLFIIIKKFFEIVFWSQFLRSNTLPLIPNLILKTKVLLVNQYLIKNCYESQKDK